MKDRQVRRLVIGNPNLAVPHYLMHSYLYYVKDSPVVSDATFDLVVGTLEDKWESIRHWHKDLIDRSFLKSGFHLKYPDRVKFAAEAYGRA